MAPYSMDLRTRVARAWDASGDAEEIAATFGASRAWVHCLIQRRRETGSLAPRPQTKFRSRVLAGQAQRLAAGHGEARYHLGRVARGAAHDCRAEHLVVGDRSAGPDAEKNVHADEPRRPDVAVARRQWRATLPVHDAGQYVFVDESGVTTDLLRRYARSPRGTRIADHTPCGHWETHTVVAALRPTELTATAVFDGPIDNATFRAYVEQVLVPTLRPGDVVVLDTARTSIRSNWHSPN